MQKQKSIIFLTALLFSVPDCQTLQEHPLLWEILTAIAPVQHTVLDSIASALISGAHVMQFEDDKIQQVTAGGW